MLKSEAVAKEILRLFRGREGTLAYDRGQGFRPFEIGMPITVEQFVRGHWDKPEQCLGFYFIRPDNTVLCTALDFDDHAGEYPDALADATKAAMALDDLGMCPLLERSQSGTGAHVWLCFDKPIESSLVYHFWRAFKAKVGLKEGLEQYPRQLDLTNLKLGSLMRYPLWNQSKFYDHIDFDKEVDLGYLQSVERLSPDEFKNVTDWLCIKADEVDNSDFGDELPPKVAKILTQNPSSLIARRWMGDVSGLNDPSNSGLMMSIATEFVRMYVPTQEIDVALRQWGQYRNYDKAKRDDFIERTITRAYDMVVHRGDKKSLVGNTFASLAHSYADVVLNNEETIIGTGVKDLDESFAGVGAGEYAVVSSRPNQGKTAFIMSWVDHAALLGHACLVISLEMSPEENSRRVLLKVGQVPQPEWKTEEGNKRLHQNIAEHYRSRAPVYFIDGAYTLDRINEVIDKYAQDHNVKLVVLDYQGLADGGKDSEYSNQTEISKSLKRAARRNDIALVSLVQMKRDTDNEDRQPQLSDLKGSGEIEASADLVLFLRWPWKMDTDAPKFMYEVFILKARNRNIVQPHCVINFDDNTQSFR